jgi:hypothetical protein
MFPANGAEKVWAIQGKDSILMTNVNGEFILRSVNPGNWEVSVEANEPYRNAWFQACDLKPGMDRDLGEIRLMR